MIKVKLTFAPENNPTATFSVDELISGEAQDYIDRQFPTHKIVDVEVIKD